MRVNFQHLLEQSQLQALQRVSAAMFEQGRVEGDTEEQEFLLRARAKLEQREVSDERES